MSNHTDPPNRRIERRTHILTTPTVLALIGVLVIVAGGILWAIFGRAPETVDGRGIITPRGDAIAVSAPATGHVPDVTDVTTGVVRAGRPIARIRRADGTVVPVRARRAGTLAEISVIPGTHVVAGQPIAVLTPDFTPTAVASFMPAGPAESITPGMRALVSPMNLPTSRYGAIEGVVTSVAPIAASSARLSALLFGNDSLVKYFTESGPVLEVRVRLRRTTRTPSGFNWTIGDGPAMRVTAGTLATVSVITDDASIASNLVG